MADTSTACGVNSMLYRTEPVEWRVSPGLVPYDEAAAGMEARVEAILAGEASELVWLLEHPPLYTAGISARREDLLDPGRFPVFDTRRGGQYTYHGPGQRVVYLMLDLRARGRDIRCFVAGLENWLIASLAELGVQAGRRTGRVGLWVAGESGQTTTERKIAAIGVRVKRFVTCHGIALNVVPDLSHFAGIVPCGIAEHGVTSLAELGVPHDMALVDRTLAAAFSRHFGPTGTAFVP